MRLSRDKALTLAQQLSRRASAASGVRRIGAYTGSEECRLLAAILQGETQDVLDLDLWLIQRAKYWEERGDHELAEACRLVAASLRGD